MWSVFGVELLTIIIVSQGLDILVVTNKGISLYNTTSRERTKLLDENEFMIREVDYYYSRNEVYGLTTRQIIRCPLTGSSSHGYRPVVYSEDEYNFMSMAVDWVHDLLYWTAGPVFMIHKAALNGSDHRVIYRGYYIDNTHKKLMVDPLAGLLIWASTNQIFSTDLNAKSLNEIRFPEVLGSVKSRVKNLALDVTQSRVYFLAGFEDDDVWLLMSGNYDGSGFRRHDSVSRFTYAMAAMGDDVFWITKTMGDGTYSSGPMFFNMVLYKASSRVPGTTQLVMDLNTSGVWAMKICDPKLQSPRMNLSSTS